MQCQEKDEAQGLREGAAQAAGRAVPAAGLGQGQGRAGHHRVRGARCCRQGRHDQGDHRARQPAGLPRRRAAGAVGPRKDPDVHAALHGAFPGRRRNRDLRPQLVQPRRRRIRHGLLQRGAAPAVSRAVPGDREIHRRRRHHPDQDLARGRQGGAGTAIRGAHRRSAAAVETEPDGYRIVSGAGTTTRAPAT